ncbi:MAG: S41 family peptidase [Daejeonella sp.]
MIIKAPFQKLFLLGFALLTGVSACRKDPKPVPAPVVTPPVVNTGTRAELTKDSIFLYAKETYYWNDQFPAYDAFKPRTYASNQAVLDAIIKLPGTGKPVDKYSFLDDGSVSDELGGVSGDYGFSVFFNDTDGDRSTATNDLRIKYVSPGSPAAAAGLKRGYRITKINNRTNFSTASDADLAFVSNAVFGSASTVSITVVRPDNSTQDFTITRTTYSNNPIFASKIINTATKKVGYIVYNSFTTNSPAKLREEIGKLASEGATELIVDLRYNGGGSVSTADVFTNLLAPASVTGQVMYKTYWTKTMQDGKANILSNKPYLDENGKLLPFTGGVNGVYATYADINYKIQLNSNTDPTKNFNVEIFIKDGSAQFNNIYFLVLGGTASASELLINNLKGVMANNVKLIGQKTYGKPVGFFAIGIDKLDLYIPQFETKNQKDQGGYYDGMEVDYSISDDVTKDFGDPTEKLLAAALNHSELGKFSFGNVPNTISSLRGMSVEETKHLNEIFDKNKFKGMIDDKLKLKTK